MRLSISTAAIAAIAAGPSVAAKTPPAPSPLVNAIEACRQIADPTQRLACYDRAAPALVDAARSGEIRVVDRGQVRQVRRSLFGYSMPKLPFFSGDDSADTGDELQTTIKSVRDIGYGKYRIVLTEGDAVWETTEASISLSEPKPGQKITIKRGPMGSYFVRINGQRSVKGRRVG
jgi:hypothetical protein